MPDQLTLSRVANMLRELLIKRKSAIVDKWVQRILCYYPAEGLKFFASQKDRFANPVGYTINVTAGAVFDKLTGDIDPRVTETLLKDVVRIRAVQEFSPSQALRFVFDLKDIVRDEIDKDPGGSIAVSELVEFESRVDGLALTAFDSYMEAREKLFRIRLDEVKARSLQAIIENGSLKSDEKGDNGET